MSGFQLSSGLNVGERFDVISASQLGSNVILFVRNEGKKFSDVVRKTSEISRYGKHKK